MPTSADLIDAQYIFEEERGLLGYNIPPHAFFRLFDELEETIEAYEQKDDFEVLKELIDVNVFLHSLFGYYTRKLGLAPEQVDRMVEQKMEQNNVKYSREWFDGNTPEEALKKAKEAWNKKPQF